MADLNIREVPLGPPPGAELDDRVFDIPPAPSARASKPLSAGKKAPGMPTDAPLAALADGAPSVPSWRLYKDHNGERAYLGMMGTYATPEQLVGQFPGAMPTPGTIARFVLVGVNQAGVDTAELRSFSLSGDAPDVIRARASLEPDQRAGLSDSRSLTWVEKRLEGQLKEVEGLKESLLTQQRDLADRARAQLEGAFSGQTQWLSAAAAAERQRSEQLATAERQRHELQLQEAREARADERAAREADRKAEADARREENRAREAAETRREDARIAAAAVARQESRDHEARLLALTQNGSLAKTLEGLAPVLAAIGAVVPLKDLAARALGLNDEEGGLKESTAGAIADVAGKLIDNVGKIAEKHMDVQQSELADRKADRERRTERLRAPPLAVQPPRGALPVVRAPLPSTSTSSTTPTPTPTSKPAPKAAKGAPAGGERTAAAAPAAIPLPSPAKLLGVPLATQRKARNALRELLAKLRAEKDPTKHRSILISAMFRTPAIQPYTEAVGIGPAAIEAGATQAEAAEILRQLNPTAEASP